MSLAAIVVVLRRAGAHVTVASVEDDLQVSMSRQVQIVADKLIHEVAGQSFDLIALPVSSVQYVLKPARGIPQ